MRVEYKIEIAEVEVPRFSVEAVEGIGKLFTLATLVLNVLEARREAEIVFHGLNPDDPDRKIKGFREIIQSCRSAPPVEIEEGAGGQIAGSSAYYRWVTLRRSGS